MPKNKEIRRLDSSDSSGDKMSPPQGNTQGYGGTSGHEREGYGNTSRYEWQHSGSTSGHEREGYGNTSRYERQHSGSTSRYERQHSGMYITPDQDTSTSVDEEWPAPRTHKYNGPYGTEYVQEDIPTGRAQAISRGEPLYTRDGYNQPWETIKQDRVYRSYEEQEGHQQALYYQRLRENKRN